MSKKKKKTDLKNKSDGKVVKLDAKPLQLSFKDNLKKKVTYFKSADTFKFNKLSKEDENKLVDCLKNLEDKIRDQVANSLDNVDILKCKEEDKKNNKKDNEKDVKKQLECKKQMQIVKNEFVFGFNEIVRKLKHNQIIGILLAFHLTSHVQQTLLELAFNHHVPVLIVTNMNFFQNFFKISCTSCFGLLATIKNEKLIFNEFFQLFIEINTKLINSDNLLKDNLSKDNKTKDNLINKELDEESLIEEDNLEDNLKDESNQMQQKLDKLISNQQITSKSKVKKLKITPIEFDQLWMPLLRDNSSNDAINLKYTISLKDKFNKNADLLLIEKSEDHYFPNRMYI